MKKNFIFKFLISLIFLSLNSALANTYASLTPVATEIIYALNGQDNLIGVTTTCDYPEKAKEKPIVGDTYFVNTEFLVKNKPDYLFAMESAKTKLAELNLTKTKPIYFEFHAIQDTYDAIEKIANLIDKKENAKILINQIQNNIKNYKTKTPKKILYLVQIDPIITIGKKSYITDIIEKSGHESITSDLNFSYPTISAEYLLEKKPDIILVCFEGNIQKLQQLLPNTKFIFLTQQQKDIINRPGPRVDKAVKIFSEF